MSEKFIAPNLSTAKIKEAVSIHTQKIYDACRDKDCLEDLRVYLSERGQNAVDCATGIKCRRAELVWVFTDVESVNFQRGFYAVDTKFYYRLVLDVMNGVGRPTETIGLATFDKRVILFGGEGNVKIFKSHTRLGGLDFPSIEKSNMPQAVIEAVDPVCLNIRMAEPHHHHHHHDHHDCHHHDRHDCELGEIPACVGGFFEEDLVIEGGKRRVYATLGQFSTIRLERDSQLVIPCYDFCVPQKECASSSEDHPCELFRKIQFPVDEFFPPEGVARPHTYKELRTEIV